MLFVKEDVGKKVSIEKILQLVLEEIICTEKPQPKTTPPVSMRTCVYTQASTGRILGFVSQFDAEVRFNPCIKLESDNEFAIFSSYEEAKQFAEFMIKRAMVVSALR